MMNKDFGSTNAVVCMTLPNASQAYGSMRLSGETTMLRMMTESQHSLAEGTTIHGTEDGRKISCIDCGLSSGVLLTQGSGVMYKLDVFPLYVTKGAVHLCPEEKIIKKVFFCVSDIDTLFYDDGAVRTLRVDADKLSAFLADHSSEVDAEKLGELALVSYFLGKQRIFAASTCIGDVSAFHAPSFNLGFGTFKSQVKLVVEFEGAVDFHDTIRHLLALRRFFSAISGRPQGLYEVKLEVDSDSSPERNGQLDLYWSFAPVGVERAGRGDEDSLSVHDLPLDACKRPSEFSTVLRNWLERDTEWRTPRVRYMSSSEKERLFDVDRLVAAANMFDILPKSALPAVEPISPELAEAKDAAHKLFKALPDSVAKNSVLGTLGRLGHPSLPMKVMARSAIVLRQIGGRMTDLDLVLKIAVQCRNHFVHGSDFDYESAEPFVPFLTKTLEFVFVATDLIEAGWSASRWASSPMTSHAFSLFLAEYRDDAPAMIQVMRKKIKPGN